VCWALDVTKNQNFSVLFVVGSLYLCSLEEVVLLYISR